MIANEVFGMLISMLMPSSFQHRLCREMARIASKEV